MKKYIEIPQFRANFQATFALWPVQLVNYIVCKNWLFQLSYDHWNLWFIVNLEHDTTEPFAWRCSVQKVF